jgi:hypothetical protein
VGDNFSEIDWGFYMLNGIKLKFEGIEQIVKNLRAPEV